MKKKRRAAKKQQSPSRSTIDLDQLYKWMDDDMHDAINRAIKNAPQPA